MGNRGAELWALMARPRKIALTDTVRAHLERLRREAGLPEAEVGRRIGMIQQRANDLFRGGWKHPPLDIWDAAFKALGSSLAEALTAIPDDETAAERRRWWTVLSGIPKAERDNLLNLLEKKRRAS